MDSNPEFKRLYSHHARKANWKNWGPYLSERSWATVREDRSATGDVWNSFSHDLARSKVYRWGEDGLGGISDRFQHICFSYALWNGRDPILKERLFGLTGPEGNHGEDVKELYFYLDSTPTHSYMKMLYKYPQEPFPYSELIQESRQRSLQDPEYELWDTKIFSQNLYFDLFFEYAKANEDDILCRITAINRASEKKELYLLPQVWFRNTWKWGYEKGPTGDEKGKPILKLENSHLKLDHPASGTYYFYAKKLENFFFTENETNQLKLYGIANSTNYVKDAFHRYLIEGEKTSVKPRNEGTKACLISHFWLDPEEKISLDFRLTKNTLEKPFKTFDQILEKRKKEADLFYEFIQPKNLRIDLKKIQRQAFAGMLFSKQLYYLDQEQWKGGDPLYPIKRDEPRNPDWDHLTTFDILSVPDKWEYPYLCSWDLAFHAVPLVLVDPDFAKRQLILMTREWYMHPSGQIPAYEWSFSDVNPPVHAWAIWRAYKIDGKMYGKLDRAFLEGTFHKLLLNFTWWVNKKDVEGNNVFQGGFLGMDNISVFDRSRSLPTGGRIDQSDGSAWMSFYCIIMMKIALHLSDEEPVYQDIATKFFEHFLRIASAMTNCGGKGYSLWNEEDGFFYDVLHLPNQNIVPLKVRSLVGLIPLLAVETMEADLLEKCPIFTRRMSWFISKKPSVSFNLACIYKEGVNKRRLLSIVTEDKLRRVLHYMLDEEEFLSPYGIRSISKYHEKNPFVFEADGHRCEVKYVPGESNNRLFGGNSNWRGPIWFPINFLIIESLQKFHHYFGEQFKVEFPTGSGNLITLWEVGEELSKRLIRLFLENEEGKRPIFGKYPKIEEDQNFKDLFLFFEYFHGENGSGLGASHQTGWTGLIAKLIQQVGESL
ncbi:MAG: glucosidase [Chlamydiae bacterium]|nr:glucosidase [Chlamydiota bacterium]